MATIAQLAPDVQNRLEEPQGVGRFWKLATEIYPGLVEACNELMLLVGRPTQIVSVPFTIQPNTPWQRVPKGMLCITNIQGAASEAWKMTLEDLDYLQNSWGSDWEQDMGDTIEGWAPIGFNLFAVHPSLYAEQSVLLTGIQYPSTEAWPYDGAQTVPFEEQFFSALQEYAAHYCRFKESGNEMSEANKLLQSFLDQASRMTQVQDRRDIYIFNRATGAPMQPNPIKMR